MQKNTSEFEDNKTLKSRLNLKDNPSKKKFATAYSEGKTYKIDLTEILDNKTELAYKEACENRRFEIQMYWHRVAYFWAFIVSIYTAFFFISGNDGELVACKEVIKLALSFLGFMFCIGFYFANKGSKIWIENWEIHEGLLEDEVSVKLYKTFHYDEKQNYSVSKINDVLCGILSLFSFVFFAMTLALSIQNWFSGYPFVLRFYLFVGVIFVVMLLLHILKKEVGGNSLEAKTLKFKKVDYDV